MELFNKFVFQLYIHENKRVKHVNYLLFFFLDMYSFKNWEPGTILPLHFQHLIFFVVVSWPIPPQRIKLVLFLGIFLFCLIL